LRKVLQERAGSTDYCPMDRAELLGRLARHATEMAAVTEYDDAADTCAQALIDLTPMKSIVQARLDADGELTVGAKRGPLSEALAQLPFARFLELPTLRTPGARWDRVVGPQSPPGSLEALIATTGARSAMVAGFNGLGNLRGIIIMASADIVAFGHEDGLIFELLTSQAVGVLRATKLVPSLRRYARLDPLTELGHHGAFSETLSARSGSGHHALILVDVDHFKQCNDERGHREGDAVLRTVARALEGVLRESDAVFRIGGDEFAAIVEVHTEMEALEMGRRMRAAVLAAEAGISVSIGIAIGAEGESGARLRDRADGALYRVKAAGRDAVATDAGAAQSADLDVAA
jgi:diguanylate cyclase (GGDEF)-like protein